MPVELGELPGERLPEAVELAAYFVVAEALTNVAKYAEATHATVLVERDNGRVVVEVADDGIGGADPDAGRACAGWPTGSRCSRAGSRWSRSRATEPR